MFAKKTFARERSLEKAGEGQRRRERSSENVREGRRVIESSRGETLRATLRNAIFVRLDLRSDVSVYATDASKTLLPWNIFIALCVSRLLYCSAVLYIQNNIDSTLCAIFSLWLC